MSNSDYAIGWNEARGGLEDLTGRNENADDYCDRILAAVCDSKTNRKMYPIGAADCISWFKENRCLPPRLSWVDEKEPWNDVEGSVSGYVMKERFTTPKDEN